MAGAPKVWPTPEEPLPSFQQGPQANVPGVKPAALGLWGGLSRGRTDRERTESPSAWTHERGNSRGRQTEMEEPGLRSPPPLTYSHITGPYVTLVESLRSKNRRFTWAQC